MNHLVKILFDEDGTKQESPKWHLATPFGDAYRTVCTGEVFGFGEGSVIFKEKIATKGITCSDCKDMVEWFKSVKL